METTFYIILPNIRYKKHENDIYFVSNTPIKLKKNEKSYYQTEFPLHLQKRKYTFHYHQNSYECCIIEEEEENGLNVSVKYKRNSQFSHNSIVHDSFRIKELAKLFEAYLLDITSYLEKHEEENNNLNSSVSEKNVNDSTSFHNSTSVNDSISFRNSTNIPCSVAESYSSKVSSFSVGKKPESKIVQEKYISKNNNSHIYKSDDYYMEDINDQEHYNDEDYAGDYAGDYAEDYDEDYD